MMTRDDWGSQDRATNVLDEYGSQGITRDD